MDERTHKQPRFTSHTLEYLTILERDGGLFLFQKPFYLGSMKEVHYFFFLILLNSIRELVGKQKAGQEIK